MSYIPCSVEQILRRDWLLSIPEHLHDKLCDIPASTNITSRILVNTPREHGTPRQVGDHVTVRYGGDHGLYRTQALDSSLVWNASLAAAAMIDQELLYASWGDKKKREQASTIGLLLHCINILYTIGTHLPARGMCLMQLPMT